MNRDINPNLNRLQRTSLLVGLSGLLLSALGAWSQPHQFFIAYLFSYMFWLSLALGCLGVVMIQHLTGGLWGFATRRFLEAGFMTLPLMVILFVPLLLGLHHLYSWSRPEDVAASAVLQRKTLYLNPIGFTGRAGFYFIVWLVLAFCLRKWSVQQDTTADVTPTMRLRTLSGPGIVIYPLTGTFAFLDWVMSIEPKWSSTVFPLIVLIGQVLIAFAFITVLLAWLRRSSTLAQVVTPKCFLDLGNLILAFVMFWTYISFAQFLIIYSANLPREISWYLPRIHGGWRAVVLTLALFHFLVPFFVLLFRSTKQHIDRLAVIAGLVFCVHILEMYWIVVPAFYPEGPHIHWLDFTLFFGIGGAWLAVFVWNLKRYPLLPQNDPRLEPILAQIIHAK